MNSTPPAVLREVTTTDPSTIVRPSYEEVGEKKPFGFWMKYQASTRFSLGELLDAIAGLAEADVAMKSGQDGRLRLERVLVDLLAPETRRRSHA